MSGSFNQRVYDRQAALIKELRDNYAELDEMYTTLFNEHKRTHVAGEYYLRIQKALEDNPLLQGEWVRFCSFLRLSLTDAEYDEFTKEIK